MADGKIVFETGVDTTGAQDGAKKARSVVEKETKGIESASTQSAKKTEQEQKKAWDGVQKDSAKGSDSVKKDLDAIGDESDKAGGRVSGLGDKFSALGGVASAGLKVITGAVVAAGSAVAGLGVAAIKVGSEFEASMAKASTLFGDVQVDTDGLNAKILDISNKTGVAASQLGESLYSALSAGIPATEDMTQATDFLTASARLAKAGFTDIDTALSATAKTLNAYGLGVEETDRIQKIMMQTQNLGITTVDELGASLAQVTPTAAAFGVSFEQVGAALAGMTAQGTPTAQATTQLNGLIAELGKQGTTAAKSLEQTLKGTDLAGKSFKELMDGGYDLGMIMQWMSDEAADSGKSLVDMFSSVDAGKAALAIVGSDFESNMQAMSTSADVVGEAYDKVSNTLQENVSKIGNSLSNLGIAVYEQVDGPLADLSHGALDMVDNLSSAFAEDGFEGLVSAAGESLAQIVTGIAEYAPKLIDAGVSVIQSFLGGIRDNAGAIGQGAADIIGSLASGIIETLPMLAETAVALIGAFVGGLVENLPEVANAGMDMLDQLADGILNGLPDLIGQLPEVIDGITGFLEANLPAMLEQGAAILKKLGLGIIQAIPQLIGQLPQVIVSVTSFIANNLPKIARAGIDLLVSFAGGIIKAIPQLVAQLPQIIAAIVTGIGNLIGGIVETGKQIVQGIWQGIKDAAGWLLGKVKEWCSGILDGIKGFFGIHSPSRVMKRLFEKDFTNGVVLGIRAGEGRVAGEARAMSTAALGVAAAYADSFESLGANYVDLMSDGIDSQRDAAIEATQALVDEQIAALKEKNPDAAAAYDKAAATLMDAYKARLKEGGEEAKEYLETEIKGITEEAQKQYDALVKQRSEMQSKLSGFGDLFTVDKDTGDLSLAKIEDNIDALDRYEEALTALKDKGVSSDFMAQVTDLGIEEGTKFAEKLNKLAEDSPEAFTGYVAAWEQQQARAREIAEQFYADELAGLQEDFADKLDSKLADVPQTMEGIGKQSMVGWMDGLEDKLPSALSKVDSIASAIKRRWEQNFEIHSPSRWMKRVIGENLALGLGEGYEEKMPQVQRAMVDSTVVAALGSLQAAAASVGTAANFQTASPVPSGAAVSTSESVTNNSYTEHKQVYEIKGSLAELARAFYPVLVEEHHRRGGNMLPQDRR